MDRVRTPQLSKVDEGCHLDEWPRIEKRVLGSGHLTMRTSAVKSWGKGRHSFPRRQDQRGSNLGERRPSTNGESGGGSGGSGGGGGGGGGVVAGDAEREAAMGWEAKLQRSLESVSWKLVVTTLVIIAGLMSIITGASPAIIFFGSSSSDGGSGSGSSGGNGSASGGGVGGNGESSVGEMATALVRATVCGLFTFETLLRIGLLRSTVRILADLPLLLTILVMMADIASLLVDQAVGGLATYALWLRLLPLLSHFSIKTQRDFAAHVERTAERWKGDPVVSLGQTPNQQPAPLTAMLGCRERVLVSMATVAGSARRRLQVRHAFTAVLWTVTLALVELRSLHSSVD